LSRQLLIILACLYAGTCAAQAPPMRHYSVQDGLPSATIYGMLRDHRGFLWFGTDAGVSRFDGHQFTNYTMSDGLADNEVLSVFEDSRQRIWFLGYNGKLSYLLEGKMHHPGNDPLLRRMQQRSSLLRAFEDKDRNIYFISDFGFLRLSDTVITSFYDVNRHLGYGVFSNGKKAHTVYMSTSLDGKLGMLRLDPDTSFRPARYFSLINTGPVYHADGSVFFHSKEGIVRQLDSSQTLVLPLPLRSGTALRWGLLTASDGRLWVSTIGNGIFGYDLKQPNSVPDHFLSGKNTAALVEDHEKNIWIGTLDDGVYMLPSWYRIVTQINSDTNEPVSNIAGTNDGTLYLCSNNTVRTRSAEGKPEQVSRLPSQNKYNRVTTLLPDAGLLWIGTDYSLFCKTPEALLPFFAQVKDGSRVPFPIVKGITRDDQNLYVASSFQISFIPCKPGGLPAGNTLQTINIPAKRLYCIQADAKGEIWYGSSLGLCSFFKGVETRHAGENPLLSQRISAIGLLPGNRLALGTYGQGLLVYQVGKIVQRLTKANGLSEDICRRIFIRDSMVFVATANGLSQFRYSGGLLVDAKLFTTSNGLLSNDVYDVYADSAWIYVAGLGGVTKLHAHVNHMPVAAPPLYVMQLQQGDSILSNAIEPVLSYRKNNLKIVFTALAFQDPGKLHYQYRLQNQEAWTDTKTNSLELVSLAPGRYRLVLRASVGGGPWGPSTSISFTIRPPFWQRLWFIIGCSVLIPLMIFFYFTQRAKSQRKQLNESLEQRRKMSELERQAVQAMMNQHFIFNVLNSIQHFVNSGAQELAGTYIADFARLIRVNLELSRSDSISLDEEIAYLRLYLQLEQLRFKDRVQWSIDLAPELEDEDIEIPVMIIQPLLENALWHGLLAKPGKGRLSIRFEMKDDSLVVMVTDDGVGSNAVQQTKSGHKSFGLRLVKERLALLEQIAGRPVFFDMRPAEPGSLFPGTCVEIRFPQ
jgi:two-component sensor histidine kinase/streptogramin lyase